MIVPWHVTVREWVLAETAMLTVCMIAMFAAVIWRRAKELNFRIFSQDFYASAWTRASIGLVTYLTGVAIRAIWVWALLWSFERIGNGDAVARLWLIDVAAGLFTVVGSVCVIREFSPSNWNAAPYWRRPWILALILTTAFETAVHLI